MQIIGIQIIAILFALFMLYVTFLHYKKGEIKNGNFLFWVILWILFIFLTLFSKILSPLIAPLKVVRILDLLMIGTFIVLTYITFENQVKLRNTEKKLEDLTRKEAIKKVKSEK